jgi:SAM-dependent methyltransferase
MRHLRRAIYSLLKSEYINYLVFKIRFLYFVYIVRRVRVFENESSVLANKYSVDMLKKGVTSNRPLKFICPLSVVEVVNKKGHTLSLGCRFETELLFLAGYGFEPKNIRGCDMTSYSPWIDLGNMHKLSYADNTFDTVTMGWLISYSETPEVAVREVIRVMKPGGVLAISVTHYPPETLARMAKEGHVIGSATHRVQTVDGLLALFGRHANEVFYRHQPAPHVEGACVAVFSIKK